MFLRGVKQKFSLVPRILESMKRSENVFSAMHKANGQLLASIKDYESTWRGEKR